MRYDDTHDQSETIARPERGHLFPAVHAMSGWGHEGEELIANRKESLDGGSGSKRRNSWTFMNER